MDDQTGRVSGVPDDDRLDPDSERRAREIRAEIEQTREELTETVDAIQEKLRPANVVASAASATTERVKHMAYTAADRADEFMTSSGARPMLERLTSKPFPLALTIIGATWLLAGNDSPLSDYTQRDYSTGSAAPRGSHATGSPAQMMNRGKRQVQSMIRDYPLAVGAAALILGASLGMAVPETQAENEMLGETRDATLKRAQDAAITAVSKVKEATADVVTRAALGE
jgi:Protein of unknown function (DUF3618)